ADTPDSVDDARLIAAAAERREHALRGLRGGIGAHIQRDTSVRLIERIERDTLAAIATNGVARLVRENVAKEHERHRRVLDVALARLEHSRAAQRAEQRVRIGP